MQITEREVYNVILVHVARTWERIRISQPYQEMPIDNIGSAFESIPETATEIFEGSVIQRFLNNKTNDFDWGKETKGYAYMSDIFIEQKAREIIYNNWLH